MTRKLKTKSAVLKKFAKKHGLKFKDLKLVKAKPGDFVGIPMYRNGLLRQHDMFWDEIPRCDDETAEQIYLLLQHGVGGKDG